MNPPRRLESSSHLLAKDPQSSCQFVLGLWESCPKGASTWREWQNCSRRVLHTTGTQSTGLASVS